MEAEERMKVDTVDICTCGVVMHQLNEDDYDTGGSDSGRCCDDCGNEEFQTIEQLQAELDIFKAGKVPRPLCPDCRDQCLEKATKYLKAGRDAALKKVANQAILIAKLKEAIIEGRKITRQQPYEWRKKVEEIFEQALTNDAVPKEETKVIEGN